MKKAATDGHEPDAGEPDADAVDGADETAGPVPPRWLQSALWVLGVGWLLLAGRLLLLALGNLLHRLTDFFFSFGGVPEWSGRAEVQRQALELAVVPPLVALAGLTLALGWRRGVAAALFGMGAVLCLVTGLVLHAVATPDDPPVQEDRPPVCQEHSGGDSECPGG